MSGIYAIKVRIEGQRRYQFVTSSGGIGDKRIYAGLYADLATPASYLARMVAEHEHIAAAKVVDFATGRTMPGAFAGAPMPPRFNLDGCRYLRWIDHRTGRGTFHILDAATGDFLDFDEAAYEACVAEAAGAGANTKTMTVYAKTITFSTEGVRFVQQDFAF